VKNWSVANRNSRRCSPIELFSLSYMIHHHSSIDKCPNLQNTLLCIPEQD